MYTTYTNDPICPDVGKYNHRFDLSGQLRSKSYAYNKYIYIYIYMTRHMYIILYRVSILIVEKLSSWVLDKNQRKYKKFYFFSKNLL